MQGKAHLRCGRPYLFFCVCLHAWRSPTELASDHSGAKRVVDSWATCSLSPLASSLGYRYAAGSVRKSVPLSRSRLVTKDLRAGLVGRNHVATTSTLNQLSTVHSEPS